ncbi:MAG: EAL domain-containing protein [Leptolyngbyaceae cyanobacterium]
MTPDVTVSSSLALDSAIIRNSLVATPDTLLRDAARKMAEQQQISRSQERLAEPQEHNWLDERSTCVAIVDAGQVVGLLTEKDVVRFMAQQLTISGVKISEVATSPALILPETSCHDVETVLSYLQQHRTHHLLLVDENNHLTGLITQTTLQHCRYLQLSKRAQSYDRLLQSTLVGICRTNASRHNSYVNQRYCEILDCPEDMAMGNGWQQRLHPDDRERVLSAWHQLVQAGLPFQLEYRLQHRDQVTWVYEQCVAEESCGSQAATYVSALTDISDRKRAETELIQSEVNRRAVLSAIPDYLFRIDAHGIYREVIAYKPELTLFPKDLDPVGLSMLTVLPTDIASRQLSYLKEALRTGQIRTYEQQIQVRERLRDEEVRVVKSGEDEALFMIRDISDRKRSERQLQSLIEGTAATTGQDFFPALVRHMATALGVNIALVTEFRGGKLHTLALWAQGALQDAMSYTIAETPCEITLQEGIFYCEDCVQQRFPEDYILAEMEAVSYLGIALYDGQGSAIGDLCILDSQPIQKSQRTEQILRAFAARATAELERQQAQASLEHLNSKLEAKVAERTAALQEREQFLQTVLDTFSISVFWKDLQSVYLGCNRNFLMDAGLQTMADIVGKTDNDMPWGANNSAQIQTDDRHVMQSDTAESGIEQTLVRADGQKIWIETNKLPLHDLSGEIVGILGSYQNITARKQLELDLQTSQQQLREVLDSAIAGIVRLRLYPDMSIHYDYISPYCEQNFGYSVDELSPNARLWQSRIHPEDWTDIVKPTLQAILDHRGCSTHVMEYRFHRKDESICWILANCSARWDQTCWQMTIVDTDISDRKKAESQLQNLITGTAAITGPDFFPVLVSHIAQALNVSHVFVTEYHENALLSLAGWINGELESNVLHPLENTPCTLTMQEGQFYCRQAIQEQFPDYHTLREMDAESYLGIALRDLKGNPVGVLCIFHNKPLEDKQRALQILQVFAARAAAELERQRANTALEQLNQALETKVIERTAELQERKQFLQTVLDTFPLHVFWKDLNSVYLGGNKKFLANAGMNSLADLQGKSDYDLPWTTAEAAVYRSGDRQVIETNQAILGLVETQHTADGRRIWTEVNKFPLHNLEGDIIGVLGTYQDITERKAAQAVIKQQLAAMEAAIDGISILQNDAYIYANQAHLNLFGYTQLEELLGQSWQVSYSPEEIQRLEQDIWPVLECDRAWQGENVATRKDGSTFAQGLSLTLMEDGLLICVCRDISELKQAQAQISYNALHDPLTGLPNRRLLLERIELALHRAQRLESYHYAILFLDLDRFKIINDSLGHLVGDKLLVEVSKRLKQHLRNTDMVARLGGDEFVILLEDVAAVEIIIQISERILADCQTPVLIDDHKIFTSTSIGIVMGSKNYHNAANLIRDADIAMYRAKAQERNSYRFFDATMYAEAMSRLTLENDLRKALAQQELVICYQPVVNLLEGHLMGFEALIRWQHPTLGLIAPSEFIPIAEETGLVMALDSWMIYQACEQILHWQQQFPQQCPLKISINLSAQQLHKSTLLHDIDRILSSTRLTGESIILEITERMLIEDVEQTIELLTQLASRQIQISIDDFGTGYSSLGYLHRLPVHNLKIDRTFVGNMHLDKRNYQVVNTILALSNQLGFTVVAEGIETDQQLQQLQQLGCELGQGYLFAQPLTPDDVDAILSDAPKDWRP